MLIILSIEALDMDIDIAETTAEVAKVMATDLRRISELDVVITKVACNA